MLEALRKRGGVRAIAISHPHFYTTMVEWSRALGRVPVYLNALDRQWVVRDDPAIVYLGRPASRARAGHHPGPLRRAFRGEHRAPLGRRRRWPRRPADRRYDHGQHGSPHGQLHVQLSQPDPARSGAVERIVAAVEPLEFEQIYGGWFGKNIRESGKAALRYSARRYLHAERSAWLTIRKSRAAGAGRPWRSTCAGPAPPAAEPSGRPIRLCPCRSGAGHRPAWPRAPTATRSTACGSGSRRTAGPRSRSRRRSGAPTWRVRAG